MSRNDDIVVLCGLAYACPAKMYDKTCIFFDLRELPFDERIDLLLGLVDVEKKRFLVAHKNCQNYRYRK